MMNERIQELALQARKHFPKTETSGEFWVFNEQKFAELIVEECFEVVIKDHRFNDCKGIIQCAAAVAKEHFGVEE